MTKRLRRFNEIDSDLLFAITQEFVFTMIGGIIFQLINYQLNINNLNAAKNIITLQINKDS